MRDIPFITATTINTYLNCKHAFYIRFIKNNGFEYYRTSVEDEDNIDPDYVKMGHIIHETINQFWIHEKKTYKLLIKLYEDFLRIYGYTDKSSIDEGYEMLKTFWIYAKEKAPPRYACASEFSFFIDIEGVPIHGTIDQLYYLGNGIYEIEDYKTGKWLPSQKEVDEHIQLSFYDLAIRDNSMAGCWYKGIRPKVVLLTLNYLKHTRLETERTDEDRQKFIRYLKIIYAQMRLSDDKKFIPSLNNLCSYNNCKYECESYQNCVKEGEEYLFLEVDEAKRNRQISEIIKVYDKIEKRYKILGKEYETLHSEILDYFKKFDETITVGDYDYFLYSNKKRCLNLNKTIDILKENELWNPMDYIKYLPLGKIEDITKRYPNVWDEIERKAMGYASNNPSLKAVKRKK